MKRFSLQSSSFAILAIALCLLGMGSSHAQQRHTMEGWPDWLKKSMQKEKKRLKYTELELGDGLFKSRLPGKMIGEPQPLDGGWYVTSDIGADLPLECWFHTATVDPAHFTTNIVNASISSNASEDAPVTLREVYFVDAGAYNGAPYLAQEWIYVLGSAENTRVGFTKVRVALVDGVTVGCGNNDHGYHETLAKGFETLVREAQVAEKLSPHFYEEVLVLQMNEQPVGFSRVTYTLTDTGDTRSTVTEATLISADGKNIMTGDTVTSAVSRPDGSLIVMVQAAVENGAMVRNLRIDPREEGWWVSGQYKGTEIDKALTYDLPPASEVAMMRAVRELLANPENEKTRFGMWMPDAGPTHAYEATVELDKDRGDEGYGTLSAGPLAMRTQFAENGSAKMAELDAGPMKIRMDRVWADGSAP